MMETIKEKKDSMFKGFGAAINAKLLLHGTRGRDCSLSRFFSFL